MSLEFVEPRTEAQGGEAAYAPLRLDNQLCFALYAATHAMTRAYRAFLDPLGLTYPQYLVLLVLWEGDGRTVSKIGEELRLDSGTLTPLLKRLEKADLVNRVRRREDERELEVRLTAKGWALRRAALDVRAGVMCRLRMSEGETAKLRDDLNLLLDALSVGPEKPEKTG